MAIAHVEAQCRTCGEFIHAPFYFYQPFKTSWLVTTHWDTNHPRRRERFRERKYKRPFINPIETAPVDGDWITVYSDNDKHYVQWIDNPYDGSPYGTSEGFAYHGGYYCDITDYEGWTYPTDEEVEEIESQ